MPGVTLQYSEWYLSNQFLIIDEIRLLLMNLLVKFQPDISILMIMGGRIYPLRPQNCGTGENQLKMGKNGAAQIQTPKPRNYHGQPTTKTVWFKALGQVHNHCKCYIWCNVWEKVMCH
jgi:hypothetical protein